MEVEKLNEIANCYELFRRAPAAQDFCLCQLQQVLLASRPRVQTVFDHPLHFRRLGTSGPGTWYNTVIIGQPYQPPAPTDEMIVWLTSYCISVWTRPDLPAWYPGSTHLVIASKMLINREAEDLGFTVIQPAA